MRKLLLMLVAIFSVAACTKEYYEAAEAPIININIDNSNSNAVHNVNNNTNQNWSDAVAESNANAEASAAAWVSTVEIYGEGDTTPGALNTDVPVATSFGINAFGFGSTTNDVNANKSAYTQYNPILSTKTNLNNWLETITPRNKVTAAIGDINMLNLLTDASDDYHHKFSTASNTIYIYDATTSTEIASITTNSQQLYDGNAPSVVLAAGNYTWSYSDDGGAVDGISQYLPFELNGTFRAYGQNIEVTAEAEANSSYFTIDKAIHPDSNGNWQVGVAPYISKSSGTTTYTLNDETDVLIHVDQDGTQFRSDYWYTYVDPAYQYDFGFTFNTDIDGMSGQTFVVENTTVVLNENFHYNCIFKVLVSEDADSTVDYVEVTFDENTWESKVVEVLVGGINLKEVFFDQFADSTVSTTTWNTDWDELWIVENDADGNPTKWHRGDEVCGYIVPDNSTAAGGFIVYTNSGTDSATFENEGTSNAEETEALAAALTYIYNDCGGASISFDRTSAFNSPGSNISITISGLAVSDLPEPPTRVLLEHNGHSIERTIDTSQGGGDGLIDGSSGLIIYVVGSIGEAISAGDAITVTFYFD